MYKKIRKMLRPLKAFYFEQKTKQALKAHTARYNSNWTTSPHGLDAELTISLTSYPARFATLRYTLESVLSQTIRADRVVLWLGHGDKEKLPADIKTMQSERLEIRETEDIRSFTKLIPSLNAYPDSYIVTVDDDCYYEPDMVENLLKHYDPQTRAITSTLAHEIRFESDGRPKLYNDWHMCKTPRTHTIGILPLGVGGVLYPPHCLLAPEVFDQDKFKSLCPNADDLWFYFMGVLNGARYNVIGGDYPLCWPGTQDQCLSITNTGRNDGMALNDRQLHNLIKEYGNILKGKTLIQ